ncbi:methyltransferase [Kitasatospora sp. MMS16-BH015]|uniref:SAM-dependent methyltransferase n=1 Tax=Kitasatospora sp. MMS16-BH015 TaxID=2018025 RepID=UPI000CA26F76|nr:class I SAM-dependent methyltransferase [Kitasatospora sp. MMS16-BH015]AUG80905.1 methyltransferase [Kitasatospora sp. MMS16-BH015]
MDDTTAPPRLTRLTFHGPLSEERAARMIRRLGAPATPATVLDIGCGWGEFMLRLLEATPGATGVGIDLNEDDLARGRANAKARGLAERVRFVRESAVDTAQGPADLVLCLGASHALSDAQPPEHTTAALRALRRLVAPGGRVLLGEAFWERTPTPGELSAMWPDASAAEFHELPDLVDLAIAAGFRPAWIESANLDEWDDFESAYQSDVEEWLAAYPGHPLAQETRHRVDRHRARWLRGYRGVMGLAYLTLVPVR